MITPINVRAECVSSVVVKTVNIFGANGANARLKGQLAELEYVGVILNGMAFWLSGFNHRRFLKDIKI